MCLSGFVRATLCTTSMVQNYIVHRQPALCTGDLHCAQRGRLSVRSRGFHFFHFLSVRCVDSKQVVHKGTDTQYSIFVVDNEHANQGSQCSSVPTHTLVVHNVALSGLGGAQNDSACLLWTTRKMVHNTMSV